MSRIRTALLYGDEDALMRATEPMVRWLASVYYVQGSDRADVQQVAREGVLRAIRGYRGPPVESRFLMFARLCAERLVQTAVKAPHRDVRRANLEAARLDAPAPVSRRLADPSPLGETLEAFGADPADVFERRAELEQLGRLLGRLTDLERTVIVRCLIAGEPYVAVGAHKSVDNALQRGRRKLRAAIDFEAAA